ncbi:MAG: hypothetical protein Q9M43_10995 [Sulfurimonas sp.]|nr:hypothetical protein [Sulfurimonas sp.]
MTEKESSKRIKNKPTKIKRMVKKNAKPRPKTRKVLKVMSAPKKDDCPRGSKQEA